MSRASCRRARTVFWPRRWHLSLGRIEGLGLVRPKGTNTQDEVFSTSCDSRTGNKYCTSSIRLQILKLVAATRNLIKFLSDYVKVVRYTLMSFSLCVTIYLSRRVAHPIIKSVQNEAS